MAKIITFPQAQTHAQPTDPNAWVANNIIHGDMRNEIGIEWLVKAYVSLFLVSTSHRHDNYDSNKPPIPIQTLVFDSLISFQQYSLLQKRLGLLLSCLSAIW